MTRVLRLSTLLSLIVLLNVTTAAILLSGVRPSYSGPAPGPCTAGDVNADGVLDVSDPIYLLDHIFGGGPSPTLCAQEIGSAELEASLDRVLRRFLPSPDRMVLITEPPTESIPFDGSAVLFTVPDGSYFVPTFVRANLVFANPGGNCSGGFVPSRVSVVLSDGSSYQSFAEATVTGGYQPAGNQYSLPPMAQLVIEPADSVNSSCTLRALFTLTGYFLEVGPR